MPREKSVHVLMILINQEFNTIIEYSESELNYLQWNYLILLAILKSNTIIIGFWLVFKTQTFNVHNIYNNSTSWMS